MREVKEREVMARQQTEIEALGEYNAFSRPIPVTEHLLNIYLATKVFNYFFYFMNKKVEKYPPTKLLFRS